MIREGDIVRGVLHDHLDCYGGVSTPTGYVRRVAELNPAISVIAPILPGRSIMKLVIVDETRRAADRYGKIAVIATEVNTRDGHLELLVEQINDARLDAFAQALPKFDQGKISAVDTAREMYEYFGAMPIIVHPNPGFMGGMVVHGMKPSYTRSFVLELRQAHIDVPIGIERYSSQTDRLLYPFNGKRAVQIDQLISDLKPLGVGETASGDEHDFTLGWAYVEFKTRRPIRDADDFLKSFGDALVSHDPDYTTRAVVERTIQSYEEWFESLTEIAVTHGIPRIERFLKMLKMPQSAIRRLDLSGRYASRNGQLTEERREWRKRIQEEAKKIRSGEIDLTKESFADIYHQPTKLPTLELQPTPV